MVNRNAPQNAGVMIDKKLLQDLISIPLEPNQKLVNTVEAIEDLPSKQHDILQNLIRNHIESFDYFLDGGLDEGIKAVQPFVYDLPTGQRLEVRVTNYKLYKPQVDSTCYSKDKNLYPSECRQRQTSYLGKLDLEFVWYLDGNFMGSIEEPIGLVPVMLKSKLCNLRDATPKQMIRRKEDAEEIGGYFIMNGNERLIRMLIAVRRNYPIGLSRNTWKDSFPYCSEFGVSMRSVGPGEKSQNMVLHYLTNGTAKLKVFYNARSFTVPVLVVLRALVDFSDKKIFLRLVSGYEGNEKQFYQTSIISMMRLTRKNRINNQEEAICHLGSKLKESQELPSWWSNKEAGENLLKYSVAIHLENNEDKFNCLALMVKKLFALAKAECAIENEDNPMFHEVFSSGQIYFMLLIERIELLLSGLKLCFDRHFSRMNPKSADYRMSKELLEKMLRMRYGTVVNALKLLISTGNLTSVSGLGLKQNVGLTVMAEKINYLRFLSNFRAIHRGAFFAQMRTTACRKLYPEAWGFMCPVHTPDGTPCGLLNHLTVGCVVVCNKNDPKPVERVAKSQGILSLQDADNADLGLYYPLTIDGKLIGYVEHEYGRIFVDKLRKYKVKEAKDVANDIEICLIPKTSSPTQFPGIYIFTNIFRMVRPVINEEYHLYEYIGSFEQVYMDICIRESEAIPDRTTHTEISLTTFLSVLGCLIPYPDFNQSPRNMYCCQMTKQTMGSSSHTLKYRCDTKMYNIETPQSPLVRPAIYDHYHLDDFPLGTNSIVAVISYTGYDMEDAMIINKAAAERGFTTGSVMKTIVIDLKKLGNVKASGQYAYKFGFANEQDRILHQSCLDQDGIALIGTKLCDNVAIAAYYSTESTGDEEKKTKYEVYKYPEVAYVMDVKLIGSDCGKEIAQKLSITLWLPRRPFVGDKYANRHGQKGVCSLLWPQESMPFTDSGMTPDIMFNPHGYPSRMTIGMMLESMSGKASAMTGQVVDATPFRFSEKSTAGEHYGELLQKNGFNYYGTERMYSGVDGSLMTAEIFIGIVYYIRLRHMVSDKYQVRSTGPIDQVTHQPVKGRRRGGGVRFGEMERDSLLAHGTSFLLQDRLFNCSDKSIAYACTKCGSLVTTSIEMSLKSLAPEEEKQEVGKEGSRPHRNRNAAKPEWNCRLCKSKQHVRRVLIPHVLLYLTAELSQVNISLKLDIGE